MVVPVKPHNVESIQRIKKDLVVALPPVDSV